jgi:ABC-type bacteriocin/lantibiotic exporter with double-glycine peptidase domain
MEEGKEKLKFDALLREYSEIRHENRIYEILQIICISISILIFIFMFIASIYSNQYILLFIAPLFSIIFVLLTMGMQAYMTNLGLQQAK